MKKKTFKSFSFLLVISAFTSISVIFLLKSKVNYLPKPYGYNHIVLPTHVYQPLPNIFPYQFEFSKYAILLPDTSSRAEPYWINIHYPNFTADIQITYKPVKNNVNLLRSYLEDAYRLTMKHQIRAYAIEESIIKTPQGLTATVVTLSGQVPTQFQFYTTDSTNHFLRGALYFQTALENDSLAPIIDFIKEDIMHMLYTLHWKKEEDTQVDK
jgi:gliding motility-associated lipoprotein GldD